MLLSIVNRMIGTALHCAALYLRECRFGEMRIREWATRRLRYGDLRALAAIAEGATVLEEDRIKRLRRRHFVAPRKDGSVRVVAFGWIALFVRRFAELDKLGFDRPVRQGHVAVLPDSGIAISESMQPENPDGGAPAFGPVVRDDIPAFSRSAASGDGCSDDVDLDEALSRILPNPREKSVRIVLDDIEERRYGRGGRLKILRERAKREWSRRTTRARRFGPGHYRDP